MFRKTMSPRKRSEALGTALIVLAVVGIVVAPAFGAGSVKGRCVGVRLEAPIVLPDGSVHPAGALRLCDAVAFSPVTTLHAMYVNGQPVGLMASHTRRSEGGGSIQPSVVFERDTRGRLILLGYVVPSHGESVSYALASPSVRSSDEGEAATATAAAPTTGETAIGLVAMSK